MSSAVVIVTYNRLPLLKRLIDSLQAQTLALDKIIVVNNSSTDGTTEWLVSRTDILSVTQPNNGGAGGFYTGLKKAYDMGYEWILCMDDDGFPAPNALEMLFKAGPQTPCAINCLVVDIDGKQILPFKVERYKTADEIKQAFIAGTLMPFNGTLFSREVFSKVGFPNADMVIWGDETEFFYRISRKGKIPTGTVTSALFYHPVNNGKFYLSNWDIINDWKAYFFIRNKLQVYNSKYRFKATAYLHYFLFSGVFIALILLVNRNRRSKLTLFKTAFTHAIMKKVNWSITDVRSYVKSLKEN